jgi:hypothetical protein
MIRMNLLALEDTPVAYRTQKAKSFFLFGLQVLCKVSGVDSAGVSEVVGSSTVGFSTSLVSASLTVNFPKNPLRVITARSSHFEDFYNDGTQHLAYFIDTLVCGHQQVTFFGDICAGKKRHRCPECAQAQVLALPPKKPAASVPAPAERKKAA